MGGSGGEGVCLWTNPAGFVVVAVVAVVAVVVLNENLPWPPFFPHSR